MQVLLSPCPNHLFLKIPPFINVLLLFFGLTALFLLRALQDAVFVRVAGQLVGWPGSRFMTFVFTVSPGAHSDHWLLRTYLQPAIVNVLVLSCFYFENVSD